jgi:hypothetical protein
MAGDIQNLLASSSVADIQNTASPILTSANSTVNGAVSSVLRDFTQAQNQGTVDSFTNKGYQQIFTAMGYDPNQVAVLNQDNSNPVINAGVAGASDVFMSIVNKKLSQQNFGPLKSLNTLTRLIQNPTATIYENLPSSLTKLHWFVVAMETLLRKNNLPNVSSFGKTNPAVLVDTRSYAQDLVDQHVPKFKFLFLMNIKFKGQFATFFNNGFTFLLKTADRPKFKFDYEEINMYNFRTRAAKMIVYDPITISLYDSVDNTAMAFLLSYMEIMSPMMRSQISTTTNPTGAKQSDSTNATASIIDSSGMNFDGGFFPSATGGNPWAGSLSPAALQNAGGGSISNVAPYEELTIIDEITIYHVYKFGVLADIYHYVNPRITDFTLDGLDMSEGGSVSQMTFNFMYDAVNIEMGRSTTDADVLRGLNQSVPPDVKQLNYQGAQALQTTPASPKARTLAPTANSQAIAAQATQSAPATPSRELRLSNDIQSLQSAGLSAAIATQTAVSRTPRGPTDPITNFDLLSAKTPLVPNNPVNNVPSSASAIPGILSTDFATSIPNI